MKPNYNVKLKAELKNISDTDVTVLVESEVYQNWKSYFTKRNTENVVANLHVSQSGYVITSFQFRPITFYKYSLLI